MYLYNGTPSDNIPISDRGLQYGDGLFETIEVRHGKPLFLNQHLQRLQKGCEKLLIPCPDLNLLRQEAYQHSTNTEHAVLKIIITRGSGGRGYRQPDPIQSSRLLGLFPYPSYPDFYQTSGIKVRICQQRLANNPVLAGIKHLNRLEQVLARAEWQDDEYQEGLMLDYQDKLIEGTMSNVFLVKSGRLYTPSLIESGISGIVRDNILALSNNLLPAVQTNLSLADLYNADEVFVTNSIIGLWPVTQIAEQRFQIGEYTRTLQNRYRELRQQEMA